jgi:hypothetical protein
VSELRRIIEELQAAVRALEPPFLALPERGETAEQMAYRRGLRDAYTKVLIALNGVR